MARYRAPLDPDCPEAAAFFESLYDDPMTAAMGAPVDDITEGYEAGHRLKCRRCREYGVANIEVVN